MTTKIFQSTSRQVMFIAAFFLALALSSCTTATKGTATNQNEAKQASTTQAQAFNKDLNCEEHFEASKRAHDIAALFDAQYDAAKSKRLEVVSSATGYIYFEQDQSDLDKIKKEMAAYKAQSEKFTLIAQNHEDAIRTLSAKQIDACLL